MNSLSGLTRWLSQEGRRAKRSKARKVRRSLLNKRWHHEERENLDILPSSFSTIFNFLNRAPSFWGPLHTPSTRSTCSHG
jgi:hypothetical protein